MNKFKFAFSVSLNCILSALIIMLQFLIIGSKDMFEYVGISLTPEQWVYVLRLLYLALLANMYYFFKPQIKAFALKVRDYFQS
ncbi:hypothetical protein [Lonepinella sp. MS14436]|uniref:hypothetical protein n=1 Tax=Lonepinella sp. MS14436 TaxID=3003619 RepID=UPI0036DF449C